MIPTLIIRADAGGALGSGHIMRMIALAQAYQRRGGQVVIASAQCPDPIVQRVEEMSLQHVMLPNCELGSSRDAVATLSLCQKMDNAWIVLDGYHFEESYQKKISGHDIKVLAIDDYGHCKTWHCDAVLNQNLGAENWTDRKSNNPDTQWLLGSSFALIREEFFESIRTAKSKKLPAKNILITLGGSDPDNVTSLLLQAFELLDPNDFHLRILVGGGNLHHPSLESLAASSKHHIKLLTNVRDMPSMYEWADAVISAGGSTCWEWLAYGLPGAIVTIADNQIPLVNEFTERDLALCLGWFTDFDLNIWSGQLKTWLSGLTVWGDFGSRQRIIDGYGAARVVALLTDGLWCRPAQLKDAKLYFDWANDPAVRACGFHTDPLLWPTHYTWFKKTLGNPQAFLYVVSNYKDEKIGQVRLAPDPTKHLEVGFSIDASYRNKGLGLRMLSLILDQAPHDRWDILSLIARVKRENEPSAKIFLRLGFKQVNDDEEHDCLVYLKH